MPVRSVHQDDHCSEQVVDGALRDLASLELSLAEEVAQLMSVRAPAERKKRKERYGGKPLWWWRFKLLTWVHGRGSHTDHAYDLLRGLRLALQQWDDAELLRFLKQLGRMGAQRHQQGRGRSA